MRLFPPRPGTGVLCFIDDDPDELHRFEEAMKKFEYTCVTATNYSEIQQKLKEQKLSPDLWCSTSTSLLRGQRIVRNNARRWLRGTPSLNIKRANSGHTWRRCIKEPQAALSGCENAGRITMCPSSCSPEKEILRMQFSALKRVQRLY